MSGVIIVGVDGSETANKAAESARDLAQALGMTLHVVTAFEEGTAIVFGTGNDQQVRTPEVHAQAVARGAAQGLGSPKIEIGYSAVRGKPAHALIAQAEQLEAQMIVVGNKGLQGLGRVLGSVANHVVHHAPCDVVIVKTA